jgi:cysteine-rich repeat protein
MAQLFEVTSDRGTANVQTEGDYIMKFYKTMFLIAFLLCVSSCSDSVFSVVKLNVEQRSAPRFDLIDVKLIDSSGKILDKIKIENNGSEIPVTFFLEFDSRHKNEKISIIVDGHDSEKVVFRGQDVLSVGKDIEIIVDFCGDGKTESNINEECDDANQIEGDGCDSNCTVSRCGNGVFSEDEKCFELAQEINVGLQPTELRIDDVNGDALSDIVVFNAASDTVNLFLASPDGFQPINLPQVVDSINGLLCVEVADLNGDQKKDIISLDVTPNTGGFVFWLQTEKSRFDLVEFDIKPSSGFRFEKMLIGDFIVDGQQQPDLVAIDSLGVIFIIENQTSPSSFDMRFLLKNIFNETGPLVDESFVFGTFSGSGVVDFATIDFSLDAMLVNVYENNGNGNLNLSSSEVPLLIPNDNVRAETRFFSIDVTGDEIDEYLIANDSSNRLDVLTGMDSTPSILESLDLSLVPNSISSSDDIFVLGNDLNDVFDSVVIFIPIDT